MKAASSSVEGGLAAFRLIVCFVCVTLEVNLVQIESFFHHIYRFF